MGNAYIVNSDINSTLYKSNHALKQVFYLIDNEYFSNSKFTQILMKIKFHKYRASRITLEVLNHFLTDP